MTKISKQCKYWRGTKDLCTQNWGDFHIPCSSLPSCSTCDITHKAASTNCPAYGQEKRISELCATQKPDSQEAWVGGAFNSVLALILKLPLSSLMGIKFFPTRGPQSEVSLSLVILDSFFFMTCPCHRDVLSSERILICHELHLTIKWPPFSKYRLSLHLVQPNKLDHLLIMAKFPQKNC